MRAVISHFRRLQEECPGSARVTALLRTGSESLNPPVYLLSLLRPSTDHYSRLISLPLLHVRAGSRTPGGAAPRSVVRAYVPS